MDKINEFQQEKLTLTKSRTRAGKSNTWSAADHPFHSADGTLIGDAKNIKITIFEDTDTPATGLITAHFELTATGWQSNQFVSGVLVQDANNGTLVNWVLPAVTIACGQVSVPYDFTKAISAGILDVTASVSFGAISGTARPCASVV